MFNSRVFCIGHRNFVSTLQIGDSILSICEIGLHRSRRQARSNRIKIDVRHASSDRGHEPKGRLLHYDLDGNFIEDASMCLKLK